MAKPVSGIIASALTVLILIHFLDAIISTGLAPEPGSPLYLEWAHIINALADVLPMLVMGIGAVAAYIFVQMRSGF